MWAVAKTHGIGNIIKYIGLNQVQQAVELEERCVISVERGAMQTSKSARGTGGSTISTKRARGLGERATRHHPRSIKHVIYDVSRPQDIRSGTRAWAGVRFRPQRDHSSRNNVSVSHANRSNTPLLGT